MVDKIVALVGVMYKVQHTYMLDKLGCKACDLQFQLCLGLT